MNKVKGYVFSFEVWAKGVIAILIGGAGSTLTAHFADPTSITFDHKGVHKIAAVGGAGALIALFHLLQTPPKSKTDTAAK